LHSRRFDTFQWEIMFGKQLRIGHHQTVSLLGFTCIPEGMPILAMATDASTNCRPKGQSRWIPLGQIQLTLYRPCRKPTRDLATLRFGDQWTKAQSRVAKMFWSTQPNHSKNR